MIQLQVLNHIVDTGDPSFFLLNNLTDEFFSDYLEEFHYIVNHYNRYGNVPDKESFLSEFPSFDVIDVKETPRYLLDELYKDKNRRFMANAFNKIRKKLMDSDDESAMNEFMKTAEALGQARHLDCVDIFKDTSRFQDYVDRCGNLDKYYVPTGFPELDAVFGGWDRENELATIVARTNQGKTWLLIKTAVAAAEKGLNVGYFSGEMTVNKVAYRADTLLGNISNTAITQGNDMIMNEYKRYIESIEKGRIKGSLKILTPDMVDGHVGVTALRAFIEKEHLDMLCVDQHSLLEDDDKGRSPVEKASNISKALKNLQVMKHIPIISVCQQNRESTEDTGITTAHIAQSDRIGQDSTIVLSFEQKDGVLTLQIIKSRDSAVGKKLQYAINFDKGTFTYMTSANDGTGQNNSAQMHNDYDVAGQEVF